jgi:hypothetical protein
VAPITGGGMATVAFEGAPVSQHRLRIVSNPRTESEESLLAEGEPAANEEIKPWEVHSELVFVCPEVKKCALELLPERDPDAFLARAHEPASRPVGTDDDAQSAIRLHVAVVGYALWRLAETARTALFVVGGVVALALLREVLH